MDYRIQIALALFTVLTSGVVSAIVTFKLGDKKSARDFRRSKLEDCFKAFDRFTTLIGINGLTFLMTMNDEIEWDQALDMSLDGKNETDTDHLPQLEMLVSIYFPELQSRFEGLLKVRDQLGSLRTLAKEAYLSGNGRREVALGYQKALKELDQVEKDFKRELYKLAPK
jgi:hypothetical protein